MRFWQTNGPMDRPNHWVDCAPLVRRVPTLPPPEPTYILVELGSRSNFQHSERIGRRLFIVPS